jgi:polysaccharide chain length determinant protein (PEP-CTERM system associated)
MNVGTSRPKAPLELSPAHYLQLILHRKWIVASVFAAATVGTAVISQTLPNIYTSETVILVDPQQVPESYVKATVTGNVKNRLGTLTQQILSATRLQKIIETFGLYAEERKTKAREDVIARMRRDINVSMVTGGGGAQDLQAFRIQYSGRNPSLVSRVTNQIAALFVEENLKAREQQATGTTEFLEHQLAETRKSLESQEAQLRDFRLRHVGEMPEHQVANLTVLGQLKASLQQEGEALARAEQQRSYLQTMMAQTVPVVDMADTDDNSPAATVLPKTPKPGKAGPASTLADDKARLAALLTKWTENHPAVRKLKQVIADKEGAALSSAPPPPPVEAAEEPEASAPAAPARRRIIVPVNFTNPVLLTQLKTVEEEIVKHRNEQVRLNKLVALYQAKLEAIPVREQQIAELVRDYETNKRHYNQLLDRQLAAQTATQLEIRMKGERFTVLDPAQPAQKPSKPNRLLINVAGSMAGLFLGVLLALGSEFVGMSITSPDHVPQGNGNQVLEVIPVIVTEAGQRRKKQRMLWGAFSSVAAAAVFAAVFFYNYRG